MNAVPVSRRARAGLWELFVRQSGAVYKPVISAAIGF